MADLTLRDIRKSFDTTPVLGGVSLDIRDGEFLTLVGPSGCGKSTLLRIIAGLEPQDSGSVAIGGASVDHLRPHERQIAMVFQSYALYPHMSVFENIALPLMTQQLSLWERLPLLRALSSRRRRAMTGIRGQVAAVASQLQIEPLLARRPSQLSGGQRQRVALGRAMVRQPRAFLMDEPLSNLDAKLRVHMRTELAELHARLGATFIYVTHDQVEAMTMSDRVAVMDAGHLLQVGKPGELYDRPANLKVAQFIGSPAINVFPGTVGPDGLVSLMGAVPLPVEVSLPPGSAVSVGVRPEAMRPEAGESRLARIPARLRRVENLGSERILSFDVPLPGAPIALCRVPPEAEGEADLAGLTAIAFAPEAVHVFDAHGQRVQPKAMARSGRPAQRAGAL